MSRRTLSLLLLLGFLILLLSPALASADLNLGDWLALSVLPAIGFDGHHLGRALVIVLVTLAVFSLVAYGVYHSVKRELRGYADTSRTALERAETRWRGFAQHLTSGFSHGDPELAREKELAAQLREADPEFELETFKRARGLDFLERQNREYQEGTRSEAATLREIRLVEAQSEAQRLIAKLHFRGKRGPTVFDEEWTFTRPLDGITHGSAWNLEEERALGGGAPAWPKEA